MTQNPRLHSSMLRSPFFLAFFHFSTFSTQEMVFRCSPLSRRHRFVHKNHYTGGPWMGAWVTATVVATFPSCSFFKRNAAGTGGREQPCFGWVRSEEGPSFFYRFPSASSPFWYPRTERGPPHLVRGPLLSSRFRLKISCQRLWLAGAEFTQTCNSQLGRSSLPL